MSAGESALAHASASRLRLRRRASSGAPAARTAASRTKAAQIARSTSSRSRPSTPAAGVSSTAASRAAGNATPADGEEAVENLQLAAQGLGVAGQAQCPARAPRPQVGSQLGGHRVDAVAIPEPGLDGIALHQAQAEQRTAGDDGRGEALGSVGGEQEMGSRRRLLDRLEQRVGRLLGQPVGPGEHRHPHPARVGPQAQELLQAPRDTARAHPTDRDALVRRILKPEIGVAGGVTGPGAPRQQLGSQVQHQGGLADLVGPGDEERVAELPGVQGAAEPGDGGGVAEEVAERHPRSVPGAPTPSRPPARALSPGPRVPATMAPMPQGSIRRTAAGGPLPDRARRGPGARLVPWDWTDVALFLAIR